MSFDTKPPHGFVDVPLNDLSQSAPIKAPEKPPDDGHRDRLHELIERPAPSAPFPEDLPSRPTTSRPRHWIISTVVLACLLIGFIATTAVFGMRLTHAPQATVTPSPVTVTTGPTPPTTTITLRETQTATRTVVEICNHEVAAQNLFISSHYCVLVNCESDSQVDFWENDCKNFCRDQFFCSNDPKFMSSRMKECCSSCECDGFKHD